MYGQECSHPFVAQLATTSACPIQSSYAFYSPTQQTANGVVHSSLIVTQASTVLYLQQLNFCDSRNISELSLNESWLHMLTNRPDQVKIKEKGFISQEGSFP